MRNEILKDNRKAIRNMLIANMSSRFIANYYGVSVQMLSGFVYHHLKDIRPFAKPKNQPKKEVYKPILIEFEAEQCKFLKGDRPYIECKHDRIKDSPYCREHHNLCYVKNIKNIKVVDKNWGQK